MESFMYENTQELLSLCALVKKFVQEKKYEHCKELIAAAMGKYPHAPEPHNLLGVLLEKEGDHIAAMKHFRAAWALDPTYIPVRCNLDRFGSFYASGLCAFGESDCSSVAQSDVSVELRKTGGIRNETVLEKL